MIKILVSSCLFGCKVRYHGGDSKIDHELFNKWLGEGRLIHFCPEVAAGLPTPRTSSEIIGGGGQSVHEGSAKVISKHGEDKTASFIKGAHLALEFAMKNNVKVAILKKYSPSCGSTLIYDGSYSGKITDGSGVTACLLMANGIRVFDETQLQEVEEYISYESKIL